jgi:hypothetical protein
MVGPVEDKDESQEREVHVESGANRIYRTCIEGQFQKDAPGILGFDQVFY